MTAITARSLAHRALRYGYLRGLDSRTQSTVLFGVVVVVMGSGFVAIRVGVESVPPLFLASLRFYLTAAVLLATTVSTGRAWWPQTWADWAAVTVIGVLLFAGAIGLLFVGQQYTTASVAAIVMCLGPILTAAIARALLPSERFSRMQTVGMVIGLLGAIVVAQPGSGLEIGTGTGALLIFCAAVSGSLGGVLLGRVRTTVPPATQAAWGALLGGFVLHTVSLGTGESIGAVVWTPTLAGLLLYLSVVVGGVGYVAYLSLLRKIGPTRTSFTSYVSPVVALLLGWLFLHESLTVGVVTGFALIVVGFVLLKREGGNSR